MLYTLNGTEGMGNGAEGRRSCHHHCPTPLAAQNNCTSHSALKPALCHQPILVHSCFALLCAIKTGPPSVLQWADFYGNDFLVWEGDCSKPLQTTYQFLLVFICFLLHCNAGHQTGQTTPLCSLHSPYPRRDTYQEALASCTLHAFSFTRHD